MMLQANIWFGTWSFWPFLIYVLIALGMYMVFYVIEEYVIKLIRSRIAREKAAWYFPIVRGVFWLFFVLFVAQWLILSNPWIGASVVAILIVASWTFIRNYITGLIVRIQRNYHLGQKVEHENITGEINRFLTTNIEMISSDGEVVLFPYTSFLSKLVKKPSMVKGLRQVTLELPNTKGKNATDVKKLVYDCPYVVTAVVPKVQFTERDGNAYVQLQVYLAGDRYESRLKDYFREKL